MKFLFNYKIIVRQVTRLSVVFEILFHHLVCYVACTPCSVTDCPKMSSPISLFKNRKFLLKPARTSSFQSLNQIADRFRWWIFNMDMHMIFAHNSFQYFHIFRFTDLANYVSAPLLNIPFKNRIPIFCNPNYVHCQPANCMTTVPWTLAHSPKLRKCVATKVLHLKCIVSTNDCDQ